MKFISEKSDCDVQLVAIPRRTRLSQEGTVKRYLFAMKHTALPIEYLGGEFDSAEAAVRFARDHDWKHDPFDLYTQLSVYEIGIVGIRVTTVRWADIQQNWTLAGWRSSDGIRYLVEDEERFLPVRGRKWPELRQEMLAA